MGAIHCIPFTQPSARGSRVSPERAHQDLMSLVTLLEEKKLVRLNKP